MNRVHDDLVTIIDAVEIRSPRDYIVLGERRALRAVNPPDPGSSTPIISVLAEDLYNRLYMRPSSPLQAIVGVLERRDLVAALSAANAGSGTWEPGWTLHSSEGKELTAVKDGLVFSFPEANVRMDGGAIRPGERCRVRVPKERRGLIPGFYMAIGDAEEVCDDPSPLLRFYWHIMPEAAVSLVAAATTLLNESRIPFRIKVPKDPGAFCRADAGVLYIQGRDLTAIMPLISQIHSGVASGLRPNVPLFTKRLADGLGFAEDIALSRSFGQHRCRLVAEALWESFGRDEADRDARIASLATAFLRIGLDPIQPHRGPRWRPEFEPEPLTAASMFLAACASETFAARHSTPAPISPLEAAIRIGRELCRLACWDSDERLCNWVGRSTAEGDPISGMITPTSAALGPDVYVGSAGVSLFLVQLYAAAGEEEFRRTALGGIARSIGQLSLPPAKDSLPPLSYYSGALGIAHTALRISALTGEGDLLAAAESIVGTLAESMSKPHDLDVIGGNAGAIPVLLAMSRTPELKHYGELAIALGEELCRIDLSRSGVRCLRATPEGIALLEGSTRSGLSHGAAGVGLALLELHAATGRARFRDAARRAFDYEDTLFEAHRGNWADLRRPGGSSRYELAWCNGAPGIALARLHASALDPAWSERYLEMARVGIATTLDAIETHLGIPRYDATPCHGLTGLIEIVWVAAQTFGNATYSCRASDAAQALIDRYAMNGDWPSGLYSGGWNPSLMLGIAGIGYTFLRLHDPEHVPSVLWIGI
jgi:hypothetical protein